jgi:subtilase family serine protease
LNGGDSYTYSVELTLPGSTGAGDRYLLFVADGDHDRDELSEDNNVLALPISVTMPDVDLVVTEATAPATGVAGSGVYVSWRVTNQGTSTFAGYGYGSETERFYLSEDTILDESDIYLTTASSYNAYGSISPGDSYTNEYWVGLPEGQFGSYYILVVADSANQQSETDETNNVYAVAIEATSPGVDLTILETTSPATIERGGTGTVSWTVTNLGNQAATGYWSDRVYLSSDATLDSEDFLLTSIYTGPPPVFFRASIFVPGQTLLDANGSYTLSSSFTLPNYLVGSYYLIFATDRFDEQAETNESNNTQAIAIQITNPDLTIANVIVPATAQFGQTVEVSWTVRNSGTSATTASWSDRLWLSQDGTIGAEDILLLTQPITEVLSANGEYTRTAVVTLPFGASFRDGTYRIIVQTDMGNQQREANEFNNIAISQPINLEFPPLPDLVVTSLSNPLEGWSGGTLDLSWTVTNQGTAATTGNWVDRVYLDNLAPNGADIYLGQLSSPINLLPGQSYDRRQTFTLPEGVSGNYRLVVVTDTGNSVFENPTNNESNNSTFSPEFPIRLTPYADLQVESIDIPPAAFSGQQATFSWVVTNEGTGATDASGWFDKIYLSSDQTLDGSDILLGTVENPSYLTEGESYVQSWTGKLPGQLNGNYYVIAVTDTQKSVYEYAFEGNNTGVSIGRVAITLPPLGYLHVEEVKLSSTSSSNLYSGQTITATWTVRNTGDGVITPSDRGYWDDAFALSPTPTWNGRDGYWLGGHQSHHSAPLAPGESYTYTATITLPNNISGTWYLVSIPDTHIMTGGGGIGSSIIPRDQGAVALTLQIPPSADLQVLEVATALTGNSGQPISVTWTVSNEGYGLTQASSWTDKVYLEVDRPDGSISSIFLGSFTHTGNLAGLDQYTRTESVVLPNGISGSYRISVVTDADSRVFEHVDGYDAEANNRKVSDTPLEVTLVPPPDLQVSGLTVPVAAAPGKGIDVSWTVTNQSSQPTGVNSWSDRIVLSADGDLGTLEDNIQLAVVSHSGALVPGASYTQTQTVALPPGISGNYHIFVITDVGNQVLEYGQEGNNTAVAVLPISLTPAPDLQVTSLSAPAGTSEQDLLVSWTVTNNGAGEASGNNSTWVDQVYLSTDGTLNPNTALLLGKFRHLGDLATGESYTASGTVKLPVGVAGNHQIFVITDAQNDVYEHAGEGNNTAGVSIPIALTPPPDLQVAVVNAPISGYSNQPIQVDWTVTNAGLGHTAADSWVDAVYLSKDQYFDPKDDLFLGYVERQGSLAAGESYTASLTANLPTGASGPYYAFVVTDPSDNVFEADAEGNNATFAPVAVQVTLPLPADLVVGEIEVPGTGTAGEAPNTPIRWTVTNQGMNTAVGTWTDAVYLSADEIWDINDALIAKVTHTGDLAVGESYTAGTDVALPGGIPGDYHVIVRSDLRNTVRESDEGNNQGVSSDSIDFDVAELIFGQATSSGLSDGQNRYYRINTQAGDDVLLKAVFATVGEAQFYVRYGAPPTLTTFDQVYDSPADLEQQIKLSGTRAGSYYVLVHGQGTAANQPFTLTAEKLDFGITGIGTNHGSNAGQATFAIDGAKFTPDAQVKLIASDGVERLASKIWSKDSSELWATFDLQGLVADQYDVQVAENGKTSVLSDAFTVNTGMLGQVETRLIVPSAVRPQQPVAITVEYTNTGETDIAAPLLSLTVTNGFLQLSEGGKFDQDKIQFLGISSDGPAGVLAPGATGKFTVLVQSIGNLPINLQLNTLAENEVIDWNSMRAQLGIDQLPTAAQDQIISNLIASVGTTAAGYQAALAEEATAQSLIGERISDVQTLFNAEFNQATANQALIQRNTLGAFGWGWTAPVEIRLVTDGAGKVTIFNSGIQGLLPTQLAGTALYDRKMQGLPSQQLLDNPYRLSIEQFLPRQGAASQMTFVKDVCGCYKGGSGKLKLERDHYELEAQDGTLYVFRPDGQLNFVQDASGYRITASYTNR